MAVERLRRIWWLRQSEGSRGRRGDQDEDQAAVMSQADLRCSRAVIGSQKAVHYCEATDRGIVDGNKEERKKGSAALVVFIRTLQDQG